jgi:hypothetical protein
MEVTQKLRESRPQALTDAALVNALQNKQMALGEYSPENAALYVSFGVCGEYNHTLSAI